MASSGGPHRGGSRAEALVHRVECRDRRPSVGFLHRVTREPRPRGRARPIDRSPCGRPERSPTPRCVNSVAVSAGSRRPPATTTAASSRSQHSTIALRGNPWRSAARWASASAAIVAAMSSSTSKSAERRRRRRQRSRGRWRQAKMRTSTATLVSNTAKITRAITSTKWGSCTARRCSRRPRRRRWPPGW